MNNSAEIARLAHREIDIGRGVKAFRAAESAISIGAVLVTLGIVGLAFSASMMNEAVAIQDLPAAHPTAWLARNWFAVSLVQYALVIPIWFFALASLRPLLALLVFVIYAGWQAYWLTMSQLPDLSYAGAAVIFSFLLGMTFQALITLMFAVLLVRAPLAALRVGRSERLMSRPLAPVRGYFDLVRAMFGVWPNLRRSWWRAIASTLLMYASSVFVALNISFRTIIVFVCIGQALTTVFIYLPRALEGGMYQGMYDLRVDPLMGVVGTPAPTLMGIAISTGIFIVLIVIALTIANCISWLAGKCRAIARSLSRQGLEKQIAHDIRPPILFLRSFRDDQVTLPAYGFWTRFFRGEPLERRLDHLLVENFTRYGPVVAIGRPGETDLPFGAARKYVSDDNWQREVEALAESASHIVMVADPSPGVAWEVQTTLSRFRDKTLFLAPPSKDDLMLNPVFRDWTKGATNMEVVTTKYLVGVYHMPDGSLDALLVEKPSADAYQIALQAFFRRAEIAKRR